MIVFPGNPQIQTDHGVPPNPIEIVCALDYSETSVVPYTKFEMPRRWLAGRQHTAHSTRSLQGAHLTHLGAYLVVGFGC